MSRKGERVFCNVQKNVQIAVYSVEGERGEG